MEKRQVLPPESVVLDSRRVRSGFGRGRLSLGRALKSLEVCVGELGRVCEEILGFRVLPLGGAIGVQWVNPYVLLWMTVCRGTLSRTAE